jgi:putative redox protein
MEVFVTFPGGPKTVSVTMSGHEIVSDSTQAHGGGDLGPPPGNYMIAALLLCTASTARGYCRNHDLPIPEGLRADVQTDESGNLTSITSELLVSADFPEKYHKALVRAAGTCWVKKQWLKAPEFVTRVTVDES